MQSNGGIADVETVRTHAVQTVLSGPAAGVVGARRTAASVAENQNLAGLVTFDMGGTSSDVSLVRDGSVERTTGTEIDGHPVGVPMVDVTTVGSGGGSVAWVDSGGALRVGPESAGATPGPACYGRGGERATVTDATLLLGYVGASTALGGELELDRSAARDALAALADDAGLDGPSAAAEGIFEVANAAMTRAIRSITVERGHDPREFGLVAFGGAGPMHAAALAERLDVSTVVVPLPAGVLSAYGLLDADEQYDAVQTRRTRLAAADPDELTAAFDSLRDRLPDALDPDRATVERSADLRYAGQSFELEVEVAPRSESLDLDALAERFHAAHDRTYGYTADEPVELVNLRVTASVPRSAPETAFAGAEVAPRARREAIFDGESHETPVYDRLAVPAGATLDGPAVLEQDESTTVVPPGWTATVEQDGTLVLTSENASNEEGQR